MPHVLQMGEQIPVLEIARNLIRISGHIPDQDIPIVFTGLRPGEKLYEELVCGDETCEPSGIEKIMRVTPSQTVSATTLAGRIDELGRAANTSDTAAVMQQLEALVGGMHREPSAEPELADIRFAFGKRIGINGAARAPGH